MSGIKYGLICVNRFSIRTSSVTSVLLKSESGLRLLKYAITVKIMGMIQMQLLHNNSQRLNTHLRNCSFVCCQGPQKNAKLTIFGND